MDKTERVGFWLTSNEKHLLTWLAEIEGGLSQAALLRRLIHLAATEHGIDPPEKKRTLSEVVKVKTTKHCYDGNLDNSIQIDNTGKPTK